MKHFFVLTVATLLPLSIIPAQANELQPSTNLQPATQSAGALAPVGVEQNSQLVTPEARSQQLNQQAQQINQNAGTSGGGSNVQDVLQEVLNLNLPDGW